MKATRITTVALCILLLVLPSLAMPIFPSGDDGAENRYLADYPTLADEDGNVIKTWLTPQTEAATGEAGGGATG